MRKQFISYLFYVMLACNMYKKYYIKYDIVKLSLCLLVCDFCVCTTADT